MKKHELEAIAKFISPLYAQMFENIFYSISVEGKAENDFKLKLEHELATNPRREHVFTLLCDILGDHFVKMIFSYIKDGNIITMRIK